MFGDILQFRQDGTGTIEGRDPETRLPKAVPVQFIVKNGRIGYRGMTQEEGIDQTPERSIVNPRQYADVDQM